MRLHMHINIEGVIANWSNADIARLFGRKVRDVPEIKRYLLACLAEGVKVLPIGQKCAGWSEVHGCPGHEDEPTAPPSPLD